jgi:hypothetical protein
VKSSSTHELGLIEFARQWYGFRLVEQLSGSAIDDCETEVAALRGPLMSNTNQKEFG